jgi:hypothetical protein
MRHIVTHMPALPAICDNCGAVFPSGFFMGGGSGSFVGNKSGPCPNCGAMGSIPDGFYDFTGDTLRIFSPWPAERLRALTKALAAARQAPDPRAAVEQALKNDPDLADLARRLSPMRDAAAFWGFIAVLLTAITLIIASQTDRSVTVNEQTVIERVMAKPSTASPPKRKAAPPPPNRRKSKGRGKRRK